MGLELKITGTYSISGPTIYATEGNTNWGVEGNPTRNDVGVATILLTRATSTSEENVTTKTVTSLVVDNTLSNYPVYTGQPIIDGVYIVYLQVNTTGYTSPATPPEPEYIMGYPIFVDTAVKANISKFWVKYACATNMERKKVLYGVCNWLETNLAGMQSMANIRDKTSYLELLKIVQDKIELNKSLLK